MELILINMFRPTYMPNLVTLAWQMSSGMSKEASSLNGSLCAYLMRQNLHDQTRNKCPCQVWKWSVKNYGRGSVNGACLPCCPPARPLGWRQYPGALKGCRVKTLFYINKANLRDLIATTSLAILLKLDSNNWFLVCMTFKFNGWPHKQ